MVWPQNGDGHKMKLTDTKCKNAKAKEKPYPLADGGGLYIEIHPKGSKYWRMKYRFNGKQKKLSFGVYPEISLLEAREKREKARKLLRDNIDPSQHKKEIKIQRILNSTNTFEAIAREWHENNLHTWKENHAKLILKRLEGDIFPFIGHIPIKDVTPPLLLEALRTVEARGAYELTSRIKSYCSKVFRYAISTGTGERDSAADLQGALKQHQGKHMKALEAHELPEFLHALQQNKARLYPQTILAVELMMLTFTRTKELIEAEWPEFDLENKEWLIPAERMKMGKAHLVPLSHQSVDILKQLQEMNGHKRYIFAGHNDPRKHISNNTILKAIYQLGFKGRMTGHGFRALAMTTIMEKLDYQFEVVDRQLSHARRNKVAAAYIGAFAFARSIRLISALTSAPFGNISSNLAFKAS